MKNKHCHSRESGNPNMKMDARLKISGMTAVLIFLLSFVVPATALLGDEAFNLDKFLLDIEK